jgi:hypothetical protein
MVIDMNGTIRYTIRPYDTIWMLAQVFNTTVDSIMELNPGIDPRNLLIGQVITIQPGYSRYPSYAEQEEDGDMMDQGLEELKEYFRLLWEQHVEWTRSAVTGIVHDLPETDLILKRLLRNPVEFGNALLPFYGQEAAKAFSDLLTSHLTIAAELVHAAKAGDNNAMTDADQRWHQNAEQIAELLGSINPYWKADDWSAMMNEHLDLLSANVADMVAENYEESINGYDDIEMQALEMADMMAEGISEQFPE